MRKYARYLKYIAQHKWFVFVAGRALGVSWWRLLKHDWSKFIPSEFFPYAEYFYGDEPVQTPDDRPNHELTIAQWRAKAEAGFDVAWLKHQHRNDHHFQHYILHEDSGDMKILEMPEMAVREMCSDWFGAGRAITGKWEAHDWFYKNRNTILLHPKTVILVKGLLRMGDRKLTAGS